MNERDQATNSTALPEARFCAVSLPGGEAATLIEVIAPQPPAGALAIVLDFSDSCPSLREEIGKLPALTVMLPRHWDLWCYRLSHPDPLDVPGEHTVGDLQDGAVRFAEWLEDRRLLGVARAGGSLVRPVIDAITARQRVGGVTSVSLMVLTDGQLTDVVPVHLPAGVRVLGLAPSVVASETHRSRWNRVLPGMPLYTLADSALDDALRAGAHPFYGRCRLAWRASPETGGKLSILDAATQSLRALREDNCDWNFIDGPLRLLARTPPAAAPPARLTCTSIRTGQQASLPVTSGGPPSAELLAILTAATPASGGCATDIALDISATDPRFPIARTAAMEADALAARRARWTGSDGRFVVFQDGAVFAALVEEGKPKWDAMLCLTLGPGGGPVSAASRVVMVGLRRGTRPALRWTPTSAPPFANVHESVEIEYDPMEGRWGIRYGEAAPLELDPTGSEPLARPFLTTSGSRWNAIFSGDLR